MKLLFSSPDSAQLGLVRSRLEAAGIDTGIRKRRRDRSADASRATSYQGLAARQTFLTHRISLPL